MQTDYDKLREEEICTDTILFLNALQKEDVSEEANLKKEHIYDLLNQKINEREIKSIPISRIKKYMAASMVAFVIISAGIGYSFYWMGLGKGQSQLTQTYVTVHAPHGTTTQVTLPDQSKVVLNAGSSLTYPSIYLGKREAKLSGEGYFDIVSDPSQPFILNAELLTVKVFGTKFNLRSYQDEKESSVTLEEGVVEVSTCSERKESLQLTQGQKLTYNQITKELQRESFDIDHMSSWRNGDLIFKDIPLRTICKELERKFNVQIQINDPNLGNESFYAIYKNRESLETILQLLSYQRKWSYTIDGQKICLAYKEK